MKKETKRRIRRLGAVLLVIYVALLMYFLFFYESYGRVAPADGDYRYNLIPFVEIRRFWTYRKQLGGFAFLTNIFGNVIGFIPYGFILPIVSRRMRRARHIILSGLAISLTVETIQLVTRVGCFDVDDLILNTLGAALGYFGFWVLNHIRRKWDGKKV